MFIYQMQVFNISLLYLLYLLISPVLFSEPVSYRKKQTHSVFIEFYNDFEHVLIIKLGSSRKVLARGFTYSNYDIGITFEVRPTAHINSPRHNTQQVRCEISIHFVLMMDSLKINYISYFSVEISFFYILSFKEYNQCSEH